MEGMARNESARFIEIAEVEAGEQSGATSRAHLRDQHGESSLEGQARVNKYQPVVRSTKTGSAYQSNRELVGQGPVDYKNVQLLQRFISAKGAIRSRRMTGLDQRQQRRVVAAIKNAREMALMPYRATRDRSEPERG